MSIFLLLLTLQTILILIAKFNIFPEMIIFPWLVRNGLLPYRDFFDHHGPLIYFLLAPFTTGQDFIWLKGFFIFDQTINLFLLILILRLESNKLITLTCGLFFILINFIVTGNSLWYEQIIATAFLLSYLLSLQTRDSRYDILAALSIALAVLIKPTSLIFIFAFSLLRRKPIMVLLPLLICLVVVVCYKFAGGLPQLFNNLIVFNGYLSKNYQPDPSVLAETFRLLIPTLLFTIVVLFTSKPEHRHDYNILVIFLICSLLLIPPTYGMSHLVPYLAFFTLLCAKFLQSQRLNVKLLTAFSVTILLLGNIVYHEVKISRSSPVWQENSLNSQLLGYLKIRGLENKRFYVVEESVKDQSLLNYQLNSLPMTYYPVYFPLLEKFELDFNRQIMTELSVRKPDLVIITEPYSNFEVLQFVKKRYSPVEQNDTFEVYQAI